MNEDTLKLLLTIGVTVVLFILAIRILTALLRILVPISIIIIAGYLIYRLIAKHRY